jgi:hypothetical protein
MWTYPFIGLVAGTIVSSWQGYKDPPWEGFALSKFVRSILVGGAIGLAFWAIDSRIPLEVDNRGLMLLAILATERLMGEAYKGFFKRAPHPEYSKLFLRLGLPVHSYPLKVAFGCLFIALGFLIFALFGWVGGIIIRSLGQTPLAGVLLGAVAGTLVASGGALKDSQFEGFKGRKFVRSPIITALGGALLITSSDNPLLMSIGVIGFERVAVEFFKTFLVRQIRGIHAGKPAAYPEWLERRWVFLVSFLAAVAICGALLVLDGGWWIVDGGRL